MVFRRGIQGSLTLLNPVPTIKTGEEVKKGGKDLEMKVTPFVETDCPKSF